MRRGRASTAGRRAGFLPALVAVALLLAAPWIARPAVAATHPPCGMAGMAATQPHAETSGGCRDAACSAACALCAQLAPAPSAAVDALERTPAVIRYARVELRASHVEPERATPPPR